MKIFYKKMSSNNLIFIIFFNIIYVSLTFFVFLIEANIKILSFVFII
jgi:hypothetical protein